jgi:hypothetical protein|tara:strand:+ start:2046 stop:2177 length:132 start_codon:yes stop_codon:yes gene_type:complete
MTAAQYIIELPGNIAFQASDGFQLGVALSHPPGNVCLSIGIQA